MARPRGRFSAVREPHFTGNQLMRVAEIYQSIQGEGLWTGRHSAFVRASGCNLRCTYCDTPYASWQPEGEDLSVAQIVAQVNACGCQDVVLTGGEPMLFAELIPLCNLLQAEGYCLTIETAGTLYLPVSCDLMSISPKTSNSTPHGRARPQWIGRHEQTRHAPEVIRKLIREFSYQFKFVVATPADLDEIECYLAEFPTLDRGRVMLMPKGASAAQLARIADWLLPYCERAGLRFCPRRHIRWFGAVRGT